LTSFDGFGFDDAITGAIADERYAAATTLQDKNNPDRYVAPRAEPAKGAATVLRIFDQEEHSPKRT